MPATVESIQRQVSFLLILFRVTRGEATQNSTALQPMETHGTHGPAMDVRLAPLVAYTSIKKEPAGVSS